DQEANRQDCREKLQAMVDRATFLPKPRRATRATRGSVERRLEVKRKRAGIKSGRRSRDGDE
ncbi:MAG TPA: aminoacyl-tRNA hydrolase, partial [Candidatus Xenobia bacterium]